MEWITPQTIQIRNNTNEPIYYDGHKSLPFHGIEILKDEKWSDGPPLFWCGTGAGRHSIKPNEVFEFRPRKSGYSLERYRVSLTIQTTPKKNITLTAELSIPEDFPEIKERLLFERNAPDELEQILSLSDFSEKKKQLEQFIKMRPPGHLRDKAQKELQLNQNFLEMGFTGRDPQGRLMKKSNKAEVATP